MIKLYRYELKRLLFNKFFLGLLVVTGLYSYQILSGDIILGIANTAPFSSWSYGAYLADVLPLLLITLLFFITFLYSNKEKKVATLTSATPINPVHYGLVRYLAMITGYIVIAATVILISFVFYAQVFQFTSFGSFVLPTLFTLLPAMLFTLGVGLLAGRIHAGLLYALMLLLLVASQMPIPNAFDLLGVSFYQSVPSTLPLGIDGEPAFTISAASWLGKAFYMAIGLLLSWMGLIRFNSNNVHRVNRSR